MRLSPLVLPVLLFALAPPVFAHEEAPPKVLGRCTAQALDAEPYAEWSRKGYEEYNPNPAVLRELKATGFDDTTFTLFFGTWCGDSRREVPRLLKLFDAMGVPGERVELIGVDRTAEALKQSPGGEERGLEIYRVPTLIVERGGREVSRLEEHPVLSLERDLLAILAGRDYEPSYAAYPVIRRWLADGLLADENVSPRGLAAQLRGRIRGEGDLAAVARVFQSRGDLTEAIKLFEVNCALHWESAGCHERLAAALLESGDLENARDHAERALRHNDDPERLERLIELLAEISSGST